MGREAEALYMTELENAEPIVISVEESPTKENIAPRKTIVYETHIDPTVIRVAGEKIKHQLFMKYFFFKPRSEDIQFVSMEKYYEPYIVASGKYMIDYYRKCAYNIRIGEEVKEVVLLDNKFLPERAPNRDINIIKLQGEERIVNEAKAFYVLNKNGQDAVLNMVPSASSEKNPAEAIEKSGIPELAPDADANFVRERIAKRPKDISRIVSEIFDVSERTVIYTPRFKLVYKNVMTGEQKVLELDGVTSKRIQRNESAVSKVMNNLKERIEL